MILRRLTQSFKEQNWLAIWIEFILLVAGVFLGIQVANWNEDRASRNAETRHLEEIAEDLRADVAVFDLIRTSALLRISSIDYILGETRGVSRPNELNMPSGEVFDMPVGIPILPEERNNLLTRANTVRISMGNRTGFEALIGAGGMQSIRNRKIGRQIQKYYAGMDDLISIQNMLRQIRNDGTKIGYPLGLSNFAEIDDKELIAIVRSDASYSSYLRTVREWAAVHLGDTNSQKQQAVDLLADIDKYLGNKESVGK